jgi:death on curing protein
MIRYLSVEQLMSLHQRVIGHLSEAGLRDLRALETVVLRPATSFDGDDLYPSLDAKAAALIQGLIAAAPFVDANREAALLAAECFLTANGATIHATDRELDRMGAAVAAGEMSLEAVTIWIRQRRREAR